MTRLAALLLVLALAPVAGVPADAPADAPVPPVPREQRIDFVVANTVFALAHEFGHAVIRDFKLPLLGLEEDSADTLATMLMLSGGGRDADAADRQRLTGLLALAAVGNALTWRSGAEAGNKEIMFWALHDLSVRRAARIACLIYGSDTRRYGWIADFTDMPDFRRDNCVEEYAMARAAGRWVTDTYGHVARPSAADGIAIQYRPPDGPDDARAHDFLQERRVVEAVVQRVGGSFDFPAPLAVKVQSCGAPNAYWDPDGRELRLCYELLEMFWQQSADPALARVYARLGTQAGGSAPPGPSAAAPAATGPAAP